MCQIIEWFRDSAIVSIVQALLAVAALVVSIYAIRKSHRTERRMLEIEEAREKDRLQQANRAFVKAYVEKGQRTFLVLENSGESEAREIELKLDGQPVLQHPVVIKSQPEHRQLSPKSSVKYIVEPIWGNSINCEIEINWMDNTGEKGNNNNTVTFL